MKIIGLIGMIICSVLLLIINIRFLKKRFNGELEEYDFLDNAMLIWTFGLFILIPALIIGIFI